MSNVSDASAFQATFATAIVDALRRRRGPDRRRLAPGPEGLPLLGSTLDVRADVLGLFESGRRDYGDTVRFAFGPYDFVLVHRPEDIRTVLLTRAADFHKSPTYQGLALILGNGLLTSEGEFWKRQRKLMTPAFHHRQLLGLCETMVRCASDQADEWDRACAGPGPSPAIDLHEEMMRLTFRIVGLTLFSTELTGRASDMGPALSTVLEHANFIATSLGLAPAPWVPTPRNLRFRRAMKVVDDIVLGIIARRRETEGEPGEGPGDLLTMLMSATDESGTERMSDAELRDEVTTLVLAGHETTAQTLTWTFMLLSRHPEVERRVVAEILEVCGSRTPNMGDLEALTYTGQVISESLRLYPPAWLFERQALVDIQLGEFFIPAGTLVAVCPWTLHRHPEHWQNPEGFDPERFSPENVTERARYTYLPFGGGPRQCIGTNFALYEAKLVMATLLQRYAVELVPGQDLRPEASVTLRPAAGMRVRLRPRASPRPPSARLP